jgi:DNA-binding transcriptional ArsR family regulator
MARSEGGKKRRRGENRSLLAAIRHPLRRKILWLMSNGRKASPRELAKALNAPLSAVVYHVRVLAKCGGLKPVSKRQAGEGTQHFYRRSEMPDWVQAMLEEDEEQSS